MESDDAQLDAAVRSLAGDVLSASRMQCALGGKAQVSCLSPLCVYFALVNATAAGKTASLRRSALRGPRRRGDCRARLEGVS
jgi:hypothetical protein